jgi:hypothetical protein
MAHRGLAFALTGLILTGCATTSPWECEPLGVKVTHQGMGQLAAINEYPDSEIERICGAGKAGCAIQYVDTVRIYYRTADLRTLQHEFCHVMHGPEHMRIN